MEVPENTDPAVEMEGEMYRLKDYEVDDERGVIVLDFADEPVLKLHSGNFHGMNYEITLEDIELSIR